MSHLVRVEIVLERRSIDIVVERVSIHESIQEDCVEWKPPILRRWRIFVSTPFSPVVERIFRVLVLVEVELYIRWIVPICGGEQHTCKRQNKQACLYGGYHD